MNKTAIKNFAVWARNKLIADITYKAGLLGITEQRIKYPLPQSTKDVQFYDIGTMEPYSVTGVEIEQRSNLVEIIQRKEKQSDYKTAYNSVIEEVAYTWFNRLIAVRFMEVNDYLPSRIRVLSSESRSKIEPDLVTSPFDADLDFTPSEKERILQLKNDNKLDELFQILFIKQCNTLNANLPELFEKTNDYSELLMNVSFTDKDGVVYHLVHDISEDDFNVDKEGKIEIIGWLYQYYNTEPKDETFALLKKNVKITKERIPAATQLFTPDWIVRYMVENSLGRLWIEGHPNDELKAQWKYYLDEAEQEPDVKQQLEVIRADYRSIKPEDIKVIDPCVGSGHILVYAFDLLMQIYESYGFSQRDAAKSIIEHNLYGLDIDNRAYQMAFFSIMMKARQYNRRIFDGKSNLHVYSIQESNEINHIKLKYFGSGMIEQERNAALSQMEGLLKTMHDANEYGSILNIDNLNWELLFRFVDHLDFNGQITMDTIDLEFTQGQMRKLIEVAAVLAQKYDVVVTNPPYMGISNGNAKLSDYAKKYYPNSKSDLFAVFMERCIRFSKKSGFISMITMQSWMFLSSFEKLRNSILRKVISSLVQIGYNSFPEINSKIAQAVTFVLRNNDIRSYQGQYFDLTTNYPQTFDKEQSFFLEIDKGGVVADQDKYSKIPGNPIAYMISNAMLNVFTKAETMSEYASPKQGMSTCDVNRFTKLWFEINVNRSNIFNSNNTSHWVRYNKGGSYRKWYGNKESVVYWGGDGSLMTANGALLRNRDSYFMPFIAWTKISSAGAGFRLFEGNYLFDGAGGSLFIGENGKYTLYLLGLLNSKVTNLVLNSISPTLNFNENHIGSIPVLLCDNENCITNINFLVEQNISISQRDWDSNEISWDFMCHPFLSYKTSSNYLSDAYIDWEKLTNDQCTRLMVNEKELNDIFINIYSLNNELTSEVEENDLTISKANLGRDVRSFISYTIGCMFGRYSLDVEGLTYAGGEWDDSKYSTFIPDKDNVIPITDEQYFEDDIVSRFCEFLKASFGSETLEENLDFIANTLGNKGYSSREVIRNYFLKDFFKDHCKVYQKRPIYWLFDSGQQDGFKALVYIHRYNEDTIGNLRIDYLHRMQRVYESEIARMQDTIDNSNNAREVGAATKRKEKLTKQLKETKEYDEKIAHLALARKSIDLDDGVKVNYDKVQTGIDNKKLDILAKI